jgi:V/A-type H+-transporting ATPase subunit E
MTISSTHELKQASELEQAILRRAQALAEEQRNHAQRSVERINATSNERLHSREEREVLTAKAESDRAYHRKVQASELQFQADLDRLRWELVQKVMGKLHERLRKLADNDNDYLPLLHRMLGQAACAIERDNLIAETNPRDYQRLNTRWESVVQLVAPGKNIQLIQRNTGFVGKCTGGLLVSSEDRRIAVDNTFGGIVRRLESQLHQTILSRLFPSNEYMSLLFNG